MLDRSPLKVDLPLHPQSRRRAYSDSGKSVFRPMFRRLASPPPMLCPLSTLPSTPLTTIEAKVPLETPQPSQSIPIPASGDDHETFEVGSPPTKGASPVSLASNLAAPDSPSLSRYAGMVVGSPLGLGPLNGQHLTALDHSPACSTDNIPATGSPTLMSDLLPMVRPRLPSVSETPSVAPIPENLPLPDTPRRPPLLSSYSLDASGGAGATPTAAGASKLQQQQQQSKARDGGKKDDGGWASGDEMGGSLGPSPRPRSGTWSLATSRRKDKRLEKEEEARLRRRRKSGDDIHKLATADATLLHQPITSSGFATRRRNDGGFFDSFRPRSKSDAKAILQARQRRRSGEEPLSTSSGGSREAPVLGQRDRKKEASPGFFESIRPRSKSDAARLANKKPNLMTTMKNAVQHTLVSPGGGGGGGGRGGRRSGESTPPLDARMGATAQHGGEDYRHHYTWHAGGADRSKTSSLFKVFDLFRGKDAAGVRRPTPGKGGEKGRRNSGEMNDRTRQNSGSLTSVYIRGCDPAGAASVFRESRGLPSADPRLQQLAKEEESQILVKFFQLHRSHDLIPTSAKLVIFDTSLQVKKAFYALVHNGVRAAPLWDRDKQKFVGLLTITDFIRILHSFHLNQDPQMENLEDHRLHMWRTFLKDDDRPLIHINPEDSLYEAIRLLIHHKIHRLPVIDPATGNVLYIITHKRILKFLYLYINELPKPQVLQKTLAELGIGTYTDIETATQDTLIIEALDKFVKHRVSALPIVDSDGKLIDIYAKFDVINLAAEGTYNNLNVTLRQANESRNEWFEGVQHCTKDERLCTVMDRIVRAEVHRLVVVDDSRKVIGVISLSDILKELVLKPCGDENLLKKTSVCDMVKDETASEAAPLSSPSSPSPQPPLSPPSAAAPLTKSGSEESCGDTDHLTEGIGSPEGGKVSSGDSEDEGRYSMDKSEETPPVPSPEGIPISG